MCRNPEQTKKSLLLDLFGVEEVAAAAYDKIRLPRTPLIELKENKLESLASKYFSIPSDKLWYYQDPPSLTTSTVNYKTETPQDFTIQQIRDGITEEKLPGKGKVAGKLAGNKIFWKAKRNNECPSAHSHFWPEKHAIVLNFNTV